MDLSPDPNRKSVWANDHLTRSRLSAFSVIVFGLAIIIAFAALSASLTLFLGFAENDTSVVAMIPAFVLCFGVGAIAYVPALLLAWISYPRRVKAIHKVILWAMVAMILPWLMFSVVLVVNSPLKPLYGVSAGLISVLFLLWILRQIFSLKPASENSASR